MLERLHEHINQQLQTSARTDTVFVVTAIIFNFIMLGLNSSVAAGTSGGNGNRTALTVLIITLIFSIVLNGVAIVGLITGRQTREKLLEGLLRMYEDAGVGQYYDASLPANYNR